MTDLVEVARRPAPEADAAYLIETPRLRMRLPRPSDAADELRLAKSPRGRFLNLPLPELNVLEVLVAHLEHWEQRGFGHLTLVDRLSGAYAGRVGVCQEVPYNAPELTWHLAEEAEGRGLAFEALSAFLPVARSWTGTDWLFAGISPANRRSLSLARRLGARIWGSATSFRHGPVEVHVFDGAPVLSGAGEEAGP